MSHMAEVDPRDARIAELEAQLKAALARIAELEARLGLTSRNSNKPPSSDGPGVERGRKPATGRTPGGQKGHKGHKRELLPPEKVDSTLVLHPEACGRCKGVLVKKEQAPAPWRHQVVELTPVKPHVTEYQQHSGWCEECESFTQAQLPEGVPSGAFGPRLMALAALLAGQYRLSKRQVQQLLGEVLGVEVALGSISKLEAQVSTALDAAVQEARVYVREQRVAHLDETSWREAREKAWLWVAVTEGVSVFQIASSRGAAVARDILGEEWVGFLVTDRWSGYGWADKGLRQVCWSHLLRDFQGFVDRGGEGRPLGEELLRQAHQMFSWWHRVKDGTLQRASFERRMREVETEVVRLLEEARECGGPRTAGMAREMLKLKGALFTFVGVEGLEPTNNAAERALRPAVLWRKGSWGTHSPEGSRFVERMLTVVATLKQQQRHVLEYLTASCEALLRAKRGPSLLPSQAQLLLAAA
jgi:transposase